MTTGSCAGHYPEPGSTKNSWGEPQAALSTLVRRATIASTPAAFQLIGAPTPSPDGVGYPLIPRRLQRFNLGKVE